MNDLRNLPELRALNGSGTLIRIPNQIDIPVTDRVLRLIDTPAFQRLADISQLGLVRFVYPGATHNRFEHSLGVYRNTLLFLNQLASEQAFRDSVSSDQAERLIVAALFHDVGHWPFAHPIEDMNLSGLPRHEQFAANYLSTPEVKKLLAANWNLTPTDVVDTINRRGETIGQRIVNSILSGPIDVDKMDYLYRDSLHAGVPYGQNFDAPRLIKSLCLNADGDRLAITRKGKTAAELMVFARYVMFSEVYWHHAVRSATAMFQRAFFRWHEMQIEPSAESSDRPPPVNQQLHQLLQMSDNAMLAELVRQGEGTIVASLLNRLFGGNRQLFKRVSSFGMDEHPALYQAIARRPYQNLVTLSRSLGQRLADKIEIDVAEDTVLIDAPPVGLEVQFDVDVLDPQTNRYKKLGDVSPVVKTLARRQFDDFVKQVRVFVEPQLKTKIAAANIDLESILSSIVSNSPA